MSTGDFEADLRQSVADNLAFIANAAIAAKARIGERIPAVIPPSPLRQAPSPRFEPAEPQAPKPTVNFEAEEPVFSDDAPVGEPARDGLPEGAISFETFETGGVDDDGIPVWEDPP